MHHEPRFHTAPKLRAVGPDDARRSNEPDKRIKVARTLNDLMQVIALRAAVYMAEQDCPYGEEFDGNDFCGAHLLGTFDDEPAGCIRARFFADFAKLERLAVRREFRRSSLAFDLVRAGIELCRVKGYRKIYGHAQDRLVPFWRRFGARPVEPKRPLTFSDFSYTEMLLETEPHPDAISLASDPYILIRPEGEWHRPGVLERSAARAVTSPLRNAKAA
jgi:predicted GNAT family N-acyltransferase